jgi:hypothetical protein
MDRLQQISAAISHELDLYEFLKDLKKEKNQKKRMSQKQLRETNQEDDY